MISEELLKNVVLEVLKNTPYKPFFCLPMSALLYAMLKDNHRIDAKLVTGSLSYNGEIIFKQDFKIAEVKPDILQLWSGHAWVEIEDLICDLSIYRTVYSKDFTKQCKSEFIKQFGTGKGCLIFSRQEMSNLNLFYEGIDCLDDETATSIIQGYFHLLK